MSRSFVFASESVTPGHPDKLCDQISDAIVDRMLEEDPLSRVVAECAVASGILFLSVRHASQARLDVGNLARSVIGELGYVDTGEFNAHDCTVMTSIQELPETAYRRIDIAALDEDDIDGILASHQVTTFGYACEQTEQLMPIPVMLAHSLARRLDALRADPDLKYLMPDGKSQVGVYFEDRIPRGLHSVTLLASQQNASRPSPKALRELLIEQVIEPVLATTALEHGKDMEIFVNPEGPVVPGGPALHSGLTGRKTAIDSYGEYARHSGAALSGKDPLRIDRVATYAARHLAKNVVAAKLAAECEVQLTYSIGRSAPVSMQIHTYGTHTIAEEEIRKRLESAADLRLAGIVRRFELQSLPRLNEGKFYRRLAAYGQLGRDDIDLPWERLDLVDTLGR